MALAGNENGILQTMSNEYFQDIPDESPDREPQQQEAAPEAESRGRSIRNLTMPSRSRSRRRPVDAGAPHDAPPRRRRSSRLVIWGIAALAVLLLGGLAVMFAMRDTTVTITPRSHTVVFDEQASFTAYPASSENAAGNMTYTVETREFEESQTVEATGSETVREFASGELTVYNNATDDNLRLIKNTRFETPDGLTYRVRDSIVVPGRTEDAPGQLTVTVYADEPGERYNSGPVERLTLPGLQTTAPDMFDSVYARASGSLSGGFVGTRPNVSDSALEDAEESLRESLQERVRTELANAETTGGYTFPELFDISFAGPSPTFADDGSVEIVERAIVTIPVFEKERFAQSLARATSASAGEGTVAIADTNSFTMRLLAEDPGSLAIGDDAIDFSLSGNATFVWQVDMDALLSDLASRNVAAFESIVGGYPGVEQAEADIRPFWQSSFPNDPSKIEVVLREPADN